MRYKTFMVWAGLVVATLLCVRIQRAEAATSALTSPHAACVYYQSRWEKGLIRVVKDTSSECIVQVGDNNSGIGQIRGYYSGGKFCLASTGAYFNNAGIADSTQCVPVLGGGGTQQSSNFPTWEEWKNLLPDLLKDPNLGWYIVAALVISGASLGVGYLRRRRARQRENK